MKIITSLVLSLSAFIGFAKADVAPKYIPSTVKLQIVKNNVTSIITTYKYNYDLKNRLTQLNSSKGDIDFKYSYNDKNQVSRIVVKFGDNKYVQADFTYDVKGYIASVKRTGQQREVFKLYYVGKKKAYTWKDNRGRDNELMANFNTQKITSHKIGMSSFDFEYSNFVKTGISNLSAQISIATYLAMEYYNFSLFETGFMQCIMPYVLNNYRDSRENGYFFQFKNTPEKYNYVNQSSLNANGTSKYLLSFSYTTAVQKKILKPSNIVLKKSLQ